MKNKFELDQEVYCIYYYSPNPEHDLDNNWHYDRFKIKGIVKNSDSFTYKVDAWFGEYDIPENHMFIDRQEAVKALYMLKSVMS